MQDILLNYLLGKIFYLKTYCDAFETSVDSYVLTKITFLTYWMKTF